MHHLLWSYCSSTLPPARHTGWLIIGDSCRVLGGHVPPLVLPVPDHILQIKRERNIKLGKWTFYKIRVKIVLKIQKYSSVFLRSSGSRCKKQLLLKFFMIKWFLVQNEKTIVAYIFLWSSGSWCKKQLLLIFFGY